MTWICNFWHNVCLLNKNVNMTHCRKHIVGETWIAFLMTRAINVNLITMSWPSAQPVVWEIKKRYSSNVVDGKHKQTSLSRNRWRKGSFEWQIPASNPCQMVLLSYLHLLSIWIGLPGEYIESKISLAVQAHSWCKESSSPLSDQAV